MQPSVLISKDDASVNFVFRGHPGQPGMLEARYVRRDLNYLAVYLSSQSGCVHACRMCHLTATGQNKVVDAKLADYMVQARTVLEWYDEHSERARGVHFNFMARGEAFANRYFLYHGKELFERLGQLAQDRDLVPRFLVSTIMPETLRGHSLSEFFPLIPPEIYYSIYSTNPDFRRRWLPRALPVDEALQKIKAYQDDRKVIVKLHWAFIKGQNDSEEDVRGICEAVKKYELHANIAIVRYNPYSEKYGEESDQKTIERNTLLIKELLPASRVKIITRVGKDVYASCGMFVPKDFVTSPR